MPLKQFPERIAFGKIVEINSMTHVQKFDSHQLHIGSETDTTSVIQAFSLVAWDIPKDDVDGVGLRII